MIDRMNTTSALSPLFDLPLQRADVSAARESGRARSEPRRAAAGGDALSARWLIGILSCDIQHDNLLDSLLRDLEATPPAAQLAPALHSHRSRGVDGATDLRARSISPSRRNHPFKRPESPSSSSSTSASLHQQNATETHTSSGNPVKRRIPSSEHAKPM